MNVLQLGFKSHNPGPMERAFWDFHARFPAVYRYLVYYAREWRAARGPDAKLGISALFERVRWELALSTGQHPKLNNNHRAFYARLIMEKENDLADVFNLRQQRIQATIGPDNRQLPPNIHIAP